MATGDELAKTWLTEAMQIAGRMMRRYCPVTQDGEASKSKHADVEKFYRACNLLTQCSVPLLPFQSPKLAAVAIQTGPPPIEVSEDRKRLTVNIFEGGKQVGRFVDGEPVDLIEDEVLEP